MTLQTMGLAMRLPDSRVHEARSCKDPINLDVQNHPNVSENRGPHYSTLSSRILIDKDAKIRYPLISETPI